MVLKLCHSRSTTYTLWNYFKCILRDRLVVSTSHAVLVNTSRYSRSCVIDQRFGDLGNNSSWVAGKAPMQKTTVRELSTSIEAPHLKAGLSSSIEGFEAPDLKAGLSSSIEGFEAPDLKAGLSSSIEVPDLKAGLSTSIEAPHLKAGVLPKSGSRRLLFDTHAMVRLLENNGFSTQQAEVIVNMLVRTTQSNMDAIYNDMATKVQQEIMLQRVMSQIAAVKKDMIILEKSEFSTLLAENEKVKIHLLQLKAQLSDLMNKVRSETILDMNIEKSRFKEMKAEHEKKLLEMRTEIMEMNAQHDRHLTKTNMKVDTEVAGLKTMLESNKLDTIKYLAGSVFTCLTVVLGFYRIWM